MRRSSLFVHPRRGWMGMIIFFLLLFRSSQASERHRNKFEHSGLVPEDRECRLPEEFRLPDVPAVCEVYNEDQNRLAQAPFDLFATANHDSFRKNEIDRGLSSSADTTSLRYSAIPTILNWDWIENEIDRGLPSFADTTSFGYSDILNDEEIVEFFGDIRKLAAPVFKELFKHFRQQSGFSFSLTASEFYNWMKVVDIRTFHYLFLKFKLNSQEDMAESFKAKIMQLKAEVTAKPDAPHYLPEILHKKDAKIFIDRESKNILGRYLEAFNAELSIRVSVREGLGEDIDEEFKTVDDLSWRNFAAGTGLLLSFFWWRNHKQTQRQQAAQTLMSAIMAELPLKEEWQASYFLDDSGIHLSYEHELPLYLILQIEGAEYSITREAFSEFLENSFPKIRFGDQFCKVETIEAKDSENPVIRIALPPLIELTESETENLRQVRNDFLREVKEAAPETQIPELLRRCKELSNGNNFFDAKTEMDLLSDALTFTSDEYKNGIGEIIAFLEMRVLGGVQTRITRDLSKLRYDAFEKSDNTVKLDTLLWLYTQLNTIAQLIIEPDRVTLLSPVATPEYIRLYQPFARITQKLIQRKQSDYDAIFKFQTTMQAAIGRFDAKGEFSLLSIRRSISEQMRNFLNEKNKKRRDDIQKTVSTVVVNLSEIDIPERYQQLDMLKSATQAAKEPIGILPKIVSELLLFIRDPSGTHAQTLIEEMPKFSSKDTSRLAEGIKKRIKTPQSSSVVAQPKINQSGTIEYWSKKIREMPLTTETPSSCLQMNVGLFYCLTRVIVISQAECSNEKNSERYSFLEGMRFLLAHFGYALSFEKSILRGQFLDFLSKVSDRTEGDPWSNIRSSELYHKLDACSERRKASRPGSQENELNKMLKIVRTLQQTLFSCSQKDNFDITLFLPGMIIILGQMPSDLSRINLSDSDRVDNSLSYQLALCAPTRNELMHNPSFSISNQWSKAIVEQLKQQEPQEATGMRRR